MKKLFFTGVALLSFSAIFASEYANEELAPRGCRQWRIKIFGYTLLELNNDECQNSDGNWDWGGNGSHL